MPHCEAINAVLAAMGHDFRLLLNSLRLLLRLLLIVFLGQPKSLAA